MVSCNFEEHKIHSVVTERLEKKDGVETDIVTMNTTGDSLEVNTAEMEDDSLDMPEDLSTKHRTVSVQTDTSLQDKFEEIAKGFSRKQIRSLMNVLVTFVLKEDDGNIEDELEDKLKTFSKNSEQVTFFSFYNIDYI